MHRRAFLAGVAAVPVAATLPVGGAAAIDALPELTKVDRFYFEMWAAWQDGDPVPRWHLNNPPPLPTRANPVPLKVLTAEGCEGLNLREISILAYVED